MASLPVNAEFNTAEDLVGAAMRNAKGVLTGHPIEHDIDWDTPALTGYFDFTHAFRALSNLFANAAKYSPPAVRFVEVRRQDRWLVMGVGDRGSGVAAPERERIFEAFYRPPDIAPDSGGAGLGLAIARQLATAQGGTVRLPSRGREVGACSSFSSPSRLRHRRPLRMEPVPQTRRLETNPSPRHHAACQCPHNVTEWAGGRQPEPSRQRTVEGFGRKAVPPSFALPRRPGHRTTRLPRLRPLGPLFVAGLGACSGDRVSAPPQSPAVVASVVIAPSPASVGVGEIVALSATARDSAGQVMSGLTFTGPSLTRSEHASPRLAC